MEGGRQILPKNGFKRYCTDEIDWTGLEDGSDCSCRLLSIHSWGIIHALGSRNGNACKRDDDPFAPQCHP